MPSLLRRATTCRRLPPSLDLMKDKLRDRLVRDALEWESRFGNSPAITSALSEYDAAVFVGMSEAEYSTAMKGCTAVQRGFDFMHCGMRYQVKANRPSGKLGSRVTLVPKAKNYDWDYLVWVLYDTRYVVQEAWIWAMPAYREAFDGVSRLCPADMRKGSKLTVVL